jgi:hypothetical protein
MPKNCSAEWRNISIRINNPPLPPLPTGRQALEKSVRLETEGGFGIFEIHGR